jgi:dTDP-glucose 4,6-dehydratase
MVAQVADRKGHDRRYSLDDSLLRGMGYRPGTPFDQGLAETVRWYKENRHWWEPIKAPQQDASRPHGEHDPMGAR